MKTIIREAIFFANADTGMGVDDRQDTSRSHVPIIPKHLKGWAASKPLNSFNLRSISTCYTW
jgi:hypothetical protein